MILYGKRCLGVRNLHTAEELYTYTEDCIEKNAIV